MNQPFATDTEYQIHAVALSMVDIERTRQVQEKGYTCAHDDEHVREDIAIAAAFYLLPGWLNPDIVHVENTCPMVSPLHDFVAAHTFEVGREDGAIGLDDINQPAALDERIELVTKGTALAMAELERLLRIREASGREDD